MTIKQELVDAYKTLSRIEENTQGFLLNPGVDVPESAESFLDDIDLSSCTLFMQTSMGKNPSLVEARVSNAVYKVMASKRDVGIRNMTRLSYYSSALLESSQEMSRLESAKIEAVQSLSGNTPGQNKRV